MNLQYKKNFITDIIFRIDFSPILIINDKPTKLQNDIRGLLPEFNENKVINIKATIVGNQVINEPEKRPEWQFTNNKKTIFANLSFDNFNIVVKGDYKNIEEYKKNLLKILNPFYEYYKPIEIKRIGLRFINKIILKEGDPLDWKGYINDNLISQLKLFTESDNYVSRSMGQLILNGEDYNLIFNYGIYNSEFPARVARKEFILDYDCNASVCNFEETEDKVTKFNFEIKKLFEKSIEDKLRSEMGIEK